MSFMADKKDREYRKYIIDTKREIVREKKQKMWKALLPLLHFKPFLCPYCDRAFTTHKVRKWHERFGHKDNERIVIEGRFY